MTILVVNERFKNLGEILHQILIKLNLDALRVLVCSL
jgi:hypothetical protein